MVLNTSVIRKCIKPLRVRGRLLGLVTVITLLLIHNHSYQTKIKIPSSSHITVVLEILEKKSQMTSQKTISSFLKPSDSFRVLK